MLTERSSAQAAIASDLLELVVNRELETDGLEFKERPQDDDILKAACAIANAGGGWIVIGIAEDKDHRASAIVNVENAPRVEEQLRQRVRDGIAPRLIFTVATLEVEQNFVVLIRVSPQNPPHMVSQNKRSDFYKRYDGTSERMRYEEIEQSFRDKFSEGQPIQTGTPSIVLETLSGRRQLSVGSGAFLQTEVDSILAANQPVLALIAVFDGAKNHVDDSVAKSTFQNPSYRRQGGWTVVHPSLGYNARDGRWYQDYDGFSRSYLSASGDFIFQKSVDEVLCWRQDERDFVRSPRLYSNALIEYCLSFIYTVSDIAAVVRPEKVIIRSMIVPGDFTLQLPSGEGASAWFDSPRTAPPQLNENKVSTALFITPDQKAIEVRRSAFDLAASIYSFFGYDRSHVPFSDRQTLSFSPTENQSLAASVSSYLRGVFGAPVSFGQPDFYKNRQTFVVYFSTKDRRVIQVDEDFLEDVVVDEDAFFKFMGRLDLKTIVVAESGSRFLISSNGLDRVAADS